MNVQNEISDTYDTAQDVAAEGVFVPQPKVGQHGRFVLRYRVAVGHIVSTWSPQEGRAY